jgi:hypothetical protein
MNRKAQRKEDHDSIDNARNRVLKIRFVRPVLNCITRERSVSVSRARGRKPERTNSECID